MKNLKRPNQSELDAMSHTDLCELIMQLFDLLESIGSAAILIMKSNSFRDSNFKPLEHKFEHLSPIIKANISS